MDPNVAKIIASRVRAKPQNAAEPSTRRSPLKQRNFDSTAASVSPTKSPLKSGLNSPLKAKKSPSKSVKKDVKDCTESPSDTIKRILSRESLESNVKELLSRDSPGVSVKTRTYTSTSSSSPTRKVVTKTVITEKEEKYEKRETISYSGNKEFMKEVDSGKFGDIATPRERSIPIDTSAAKNETKSPKKLAVPISKTPAGVRKAPGPGNTPGPLDQTPTINMDETEDFFSARKAKWAKLKDMYNEMDDDSFHLSSGENSRIPSPKKIDSTKQSPLKSNIVRNTSPIKTNPHVSPVKKYDQSPATSPLKSGNITAKPFSVSPTRARGISPVKAPVTSPNKAALSDGTRIKPNPDDSLVANLKAQGFTETESKSKLCYNFDGGERRSSVSPTKKRERSVSPVKRDVSAQSSMMNQETRGRPPARATVLSSPTKSAVEPRSVSPHKPHPLQFISPQVAAQVSAPPKPSRTYESNLKVDEQDSPSCRSVSHKRNMFDIPNQEHQNVAKFTPKPSHTSSASQAQPDARCDTSSRQSLAQKKSMFETDNKQSEQPDPAMLSMSDRRKLFEKNKSVPTPIARFGESVTPAMIAKSANKQPAQSVNTEAWKRKRELSPSKIAPQAKKPSPDNYILPGAKPRMGDGTSLGVNQVAAAPSPSTPRVGQKAADVHKRLFEKADWRDNDIARQVDEQKKKDMDVLLNRYNHMKNMPDEENKMETDDQQNKNKESPDKYYPGVNSLKKIKVSPPKAGSLYPELYESDTISSTASRPASAADTLNSSYESTATVNSEAPSLGMEIVALANRRTNGPDLHTIPEDNDSIDMEETDETSDSVLCEEMDGMLDEALDDSADDGSLVSPNKQKGSTGSSGSGHAMNRCESSSSWEFHTPQQNKVRHEDNSRFKTPLILMDKSPTQPGKEEAPVTHTISFYRKQRPAHVTPVQRIVLNPVLEQSVMDNAPSPRTTISQKIKILQNEAESQMSIITQSSNALALCRQTKEFYGSAEQVEGERLLLEATHKHNAALKEISRLKTEGGLGADPDADTSVRGTVCINSISLKLKKEFIESLKCGDADDCVHYFLCLVKCAGQVIPTQMLSTLNGLGSITLDFPNLIRLTELAKNFSIQLEVYGLQTMRESLDHETKYHIKKDKPGLFGFTPKSLMGKQESRLTRPDIGSPKGPLAVRTSSFKIVGNTTITIDNLKRKDWRLDSVPHVSPLDGGISFQLNCYSESQVKFRGFLTMFDDVSGFGAWHRRWFVLDGNRLSYWKYPENQKTQEPIGSIDLGGCITENVTVSPREICSRMNTFLLESRRPAKTSDKQSLVTVRQGSQTIIRHLLSADSREERIEWCSILNQALDNLRAWDPKEETRSDTLASTGSGSSTEIW